MPRTLLVLSLLAACAVPEPPADTGTQLAPPTSELQLSVSELLVGDTATWVVDGLLPGERVHVLRGIGIGVGACPAIAGGLCLDILGTPSPVISGVADGAGVATLTRPLPPVVASGFDVVFQAVVLPGGARADAAKSNPVERTTSDVPAAPLSSADLVITEVMANPAAVTDARGEWFEVANQGDQPVDLQGLRVTDGSTSFVVNRPLIVAAGAHAVFTRAADPTVNGGVWPDHVWQGSLSLSNASDSLTLEEGGTLLDTVSWANATSGVSRALAPGLDASDNDQASAWCEGEAPYGDGDLGSPGEPNPSCGGGVCGDGLLQGGEDCDLGLANGLPGASCASDCTDGQLGFTALATQVVTESNQGGGQPKVVVSSYANDDVPDVFLAWNEEALSVEGRGDGTVFTPPTVDCGHHTVAVDLDHDGLLDLVGSSDTVDELRVCWNEGAGDYTAVSVAWPIGVREPAPIAVDLDGDGRSDLVWSDVSNHGLQVVLNTGSRTLGTSSLVSTLGVHGGTMPRQVVAADFDGDGHADLASRHADGLVVRYGLGDGTFGALEAVDASWAGSTSTLSMDVVDVDEDGDLDLLVVNGAALLQIPNTASGFGTGVLLAALPVVGATGVGDLDGDGTEDLLYESRGTYAWLPGLPGAAGFAAPVDIPVPTVSTFTGRGMTLGDVDGDGDLDLVASTRDISSDAENVLLAMRNDGAGNFTATGLIGVGEARPMLVDLDDDGGLDVYAGESFLLDATGELRGNNRLILGTVHDTTLFDVTGDGLPDVTSDYTTSWYTTGAERRFADYGHLVFTAELDHIAVADVSGDGLPDYVSLSRWGFGTHLSIGIGNGRGSFSYPESPLDGPGRWGFVGEIELADVSGDGWPDLLALDLENYTLIVRYGDAARTFSTSDVFPIGAEAGRMELGDVTGDGLVDVVVVCADNGTLRILPGFGDGSFGTAIEVAPLSTPVGLRSTDQLLVEDLDGDGIEDIALTLYEHDSVVVLRSFGGGVFGEGLALVTSSRPRSLDAGDMDGDGAMDLVLALDGGKLQTWLGR